MKTSILFLFLSIGMAYATNGYSHDVMFAMEMNNLEQDRITVTGHVVSDSDEPLIGVNILEKGTSNGTITDIDGNFTLDVANPEAVLVFSYIGFITEEVALNGKTQLSVVMEEDVAKIGEVIVVAYGTQKKSSVTGAISVVSAEKLKTVTSPNVNSMLQGKVAGVQVLNSSGRPGDAATIRIRGKGTLNSSVDPLWVVDGVVSGTGAQLNPNEIETISVLKDAAATALYGSRATNGVILVTTKTGRMGESKIDVSAKFGISKLTLGKFNLMNSQELYDYTQSMDNLENSGILTWFNKDVLAYDTDWFDIATQNAFTQNYTVSYTFGNEKIRSFLSGDYYDAEGTIKGFEYQRYNLRSNTDYKVNDRLTLKAKFSGSYWQDDNKQHSIYSAMTYLPWDYPYNPDGSVRKGTEKDWHGRDASNYLYNLQWNYDRGKQLGITANLGFDYRFTDYLVFESNNNIGYRYHLTEGYTDPRSTSGAADNGHLRASNTFYTSRYANQLLRFNKIVNNIHEMSAFLGYEYSDYKQESNNAEGRGIPGGAEVLGVASNAYAVGGGKNEWAMQSVYFNANYTYNDRYMAQFSYRVDGSSRFGKNDRYGGFFTFGLGWALDQEEMVKKIDFIDQLKLRASYGSIGNTPGSGNYGYMSVYSLSTNYNGVPSAFPKRLGNYALSWEKCYETNIALDARLFDRVGLNIDYYNKNTSDLLYQVSLSSITGYDSQYQNIGAVKNEGVEVTISPDLIRTKDFLWTLDFNIGFNKSKIKKLYEGKPQISGNKILEEGIAIDTWYMEEWAGVDVQTGDPMWYIYNEDGSRTQTTDLSKATRVKQGSSNPDFTGGLMTSLSYKGLSLSGAFTFVSGNNIYHSARQFYDNDGAYITFNSMNLKDGWNRWEKPGDIATHPKPVAGGNKDSQKRSGRYLEDGSYFRLNSLTLSYDLPANLLKKAKIKYASISLSGENLFTITSFSGPDPEIGAGKDNGDPGTDVYPLSRQFTLGVNLSF
ncbi:TonB-dependent receptor [Parabacteroides sp. PFB2-10]|uniref:SusC/RagA family TonB-linked outer membrane protein n=1 Tax=Parabacteroides sp. PFB2-10 TaxID=1742405 RepID=UPI002473F3DB|nr:TonB-dependent receptor [Parabacteroides sp. PFB2-10]MDL2244602.1 TonB-dependent receptor [Parabacteroides sp. OttesenSCG-928-J18]